MSGLTLDRNYRFVPPRESSEVAAEYDDELGRQVSRILRLRDSGRINSGEARQLIRHLLGAYLEEEMRESVDLLLSARPRQRSGRLLFLKYLNEELYAR